MGKKKKIGIAVGILAIGCIAVVGIISPKSDAKQENIVGAKGDRYVQVAKATKQDIESKVSASGVLIAEESEKLYAETSNQVFEIVKEVGDEAKKGDILLRLDPEVKEKITKEIKKLELQIDNAKISINQLQESGSKQEVLQAESNVIKAEKGIEDINEGIRSTQTSIEMAAVDLANDQKMYDVTKELFDEGLSSQKELDDTKNKLDKTAENLNTLKNKVISFEKDLEGAKKQQEVAQNSLDMALNVVADKTKETNIAMKQNEIKSLELQKENLLKELDKAADTVISPMDGVVAEVLVEEGASISPGTPLVSIMNPNKLSVKSEISPFYASQIVNGLESTVKYSGSQVIEVPAKVSMVSPSGVLSTSGGSSVTTIPIKLELLGETTGLKPGLTVDIKIMTQRVEGVISVPLLATMQDEEGKSYILVVKADNTIEKRYITEGASDSFNIEIEGVEEGEIVITNPTDALVDGLAVTYKAFEEQGEAQ